MKTFLFSGAVFDQDGRRYDFENLPVEHEGPFTDGGIHALGIKIFEVSGSADAAHAVVMTTKHMLADTHVGELGSLVIEPPV